jgi:hypothetical protein
MCRTSVPGGVPGWVWLSTLASGCVWATLGCFPLEDPSAYTNGLKQGPSLAASGEPDAAIVEGPMPTATVPGEDIPGEGTPIQGGGQGNGGAGGACAGGCTPSGNEDPNGEDAGVPAVVDPPDVGPPPEPEPPACTADETTGPNGNCFIAVLAATTWDEARVVCQVRGVGFDLASIRSQADSDFLKQLAPPEIWGGGNDTGSEGTWEWARDGFDFWLGEGEGDDGVPLNSAFTNWFSDEPNGEDGSDCMRTLVGGTWADTECDDSLPYVCEGPKR